VESSKNNINPNRPAFAQIRRLVISLVSHFSKLSRRLKADWDGRVFNYPKGKTVVIDPEEIETGKKDHLAGTSENPQPVGDGRPQGTQRGHPRQATLDHRPLLSTAGRAAADHAGDGGQPIADIRNEVTCGKFVVPV
jgi:hypothetical protein